MTDFNKLMTEAKKMQDQMEQIQKEIQSLQVEGKSGGGLVRVTMNGRHELTKLWIDDDAFEDDKKILEELLMSAFNDAVKKVEDGTKERMIHLTKGLNLPSDFGDQK